MFCICCCLIGNSNALIKIIFEQLNVNVNAMKNMLLNVLLSNLDHNSIFAPMIPRK